MADKGEKTGGETFSQLWNILSDSTLPNEIKETHIARLKNIEAMNASGEWQAYTRSAIVGLVMDGIIKRSLAEELAQKHSLGPFADSPEAGSYNPILETTWCLSRAVAWISWRNVERVRWSWASYREHCTHWRYRKSNLPLSDGISSYVVEGWHLEQCEALSLLDLMTLEAWGFEYETDDQQLLTIKESREALWRHLSSAKVAASGLNSSQCIVEIPPIEFNYLQLAWDDSCGDNLQKSSSFTPEYTDIRVSREQLIAAFPHNSERPETEIMRPGPKEQDFWKPARDALIAEIVLRGEKSLNQPDWKSKADYQRWLAAWVEKSFGEVYAHDSATVKRHVKIALKALPV